ncbi:hypothetical protein [Streptomyces sp. NPDC004435]|uniref:hypothetical protein n=1 Tax=Streptomyces sp. NPDC004435 TaxID=3364701 RepID=UPI0036CCC000
MTGPDEPLLVVLRQELRDGTWRAGTVRTLAGLRDRFGTAQLTVQAAIRVLRGEGLVVFEGYKAVRAARPGTRPPMGARTVSDLIAMTIRKRIDDRTYPPDSPLPRQMILADEFDTSPATVRLPITQLLLEGRLRRHLPYETPGTYVVNHERKQREDRLFATLLQTLQTDGWSRSEFPDAVAHAMHNLLGAPPTPARPR